MAWPPGAASARCAPPRSRRAAGARAAGGGGRAHGAGAYANEEGLALPFRGQAEPSGPSEAELAAVPAGPARLVLIRSFMTPSSTSTTAQRHASLGLDAYVQVRLPPGGRPGDSGQNRSLIVLSFVLSLRSGRESTLSSLARGLKTLHDAFAASSKLNLKL
jgi:hypothetical protein